MRTVFLDKSSGVKQSDNSYNFKLDRPNDVPVVGMQIQSAVVSYAPTQLNPADPSTVQALQPNLWLKMSDTNKIVPSPAEGDYISNITGSGNAGLTLVGSSANAIKYRKVGQAFGLKSEANWHAMSDTQNPQPAQNRDEATFYLLFHTPENSVDNRLLWMDRVFRLRSQSGQIEFGGKRVSGSGGFSINNIEQWTSTGLVMQPDTTYILEAVYTRDPDRELTSRLIKVTDNTIQTGTPIQFNGHTSATGPDSTYSVYLSSAQTGWVNWWFGDLVVFNTDNSNVRDTTINYLKALYSGGNTGPGDMPHSLKLHSDLNVKCDGHSLQAGVLTDALETLIYKGALTTTQGLYSMDYTSKNRDTHKFHLKNVSIAFKRPDNTIADVEQFAIQLALKEDSQKL